MNQNCPRHKGIMTNYSEKCICLEWEKNFDNLFVYTDFADENGLPVNRAWRPTFGLPDREIVSIKLFISNVLQKNKVNAIELINSLFLEKAKMIWQEGKLDKWEITKSDWNDIIFKLRDLN